MSQTLRAVNDTGLGIKGGEKDFIEDIRVYEEGGSVQLWVSIRDQRDYFQYLDAHAAMALSQVLARLAVEALRSESENRAPEV